LQQAAYARLAFNDRARPEADGWGDERLAHQARLRLAHGGLGATAMGDLVGPAQMAAHATLVSSTHWLPLTWRAAVDALREDPPVHLGTLMQQYADTYETPENPLPRTLAALAELAKTNPQLQRVLMAPVHTRNAEALKTKLRQRVDEPGLTSHELFVRRAHVVALQLHADPAHGSNDALRVLPSERDLVLTNEAFALALGQRLCLAAGAIPAELHGRMCRCGFTPDDPEWPPDDPGGGGGGTEAGSLERDLRAADAQRRAVAGPAQGPGGAAAPLPPPTAGGAGAAAQAAKPRRRYPMPLTLVHATTCPAFDKGDNPTGRHHAMCRTLAFAVKKMGVHVAAEPRYPVADKAGHIGPDLRLQVGDTTHVLDVSVRHSMIKTNLTKEAVSSPRRTLDKTDQEKTNQYEVLVQEHDNAIFHPAVITQNGTRSDGFNTFLLALRKYALSRPHRTPTFPRTFVCRDYVTYITYKLVVCLLNHSANIINRAVAWTRDHEREHFAALANMVPSERDAFLARASVF
jgi:hypothetical protein